MNNIFCQNPVPPDTNVPPVSDQSPTQKLKRVVQPRPQPSLWHRVSSLWSRKLRHRVPPVLQMTAIECGAACLAMILGYYGRKTRVAEVRDLYGVGRDGLSALGIVKAARSYGMRVRAISLQGQIDDFRFISLPVIVHWEFNHFMVVERWSADH